MARVELRPNLIEIDDLVRVESGPALKEAVATLEILSDKVTAEHYKVGAVDARCKEIVLGETFSYLDWLSGDVVWYVYRFEPMPNELADARRVERGTHYWAVKAVYPTQHEAEAFARSLLPVSADG